MKNKWFYIIGGLIIVTVLYYIFLGSKSVEYSEISDGPHLAGNPEASVVLVEFSDFQCPACGDASFLAKDLLKEYGDKLRFEYRHFPLVGIHPYAYRAAVAAECAADQDKFWEYHDLLFLNQDKLKKNDLQSYAFRINGLDNEIWLDCLNSGTKEVRVNEDLQEAENMGFDSTPTFVLNGQKVENYLELSEKIKSLLEPLIPLKQSTSSQSYLDIKTSL